MDKNSREYKMNQQFKIGRKLLPVNLAIREYDAANDEWNSVAFISAKESVRGRLASSMSDDELIALYINEPRFWTVR